DRLKAIQNDLVEMNKRLAKAFEGISKDISELQKDVKALQASEAGLKLKLKNAVNRIAALEKQVGDMKKVPPDVTLEGPTQDVVEDIAGRLERIEKKLANGGQVQAKASPLPAATGRVVLVNLHPEQLLFVVNGRNYRVGSGAPMVLDRFPAGAFTYEMISPTWGLRARATSTVPAGETI